MISEEDETEIQSSHVSIGLINPKSASNVAVVLRAAGCFGVNEVVYTGVRYTYAKAFYEDTKKFRDTIPTQAVDDVIAATPTDVRKIAIELTEGAIPLPNYRHPEKACYIFGPEDGSIPQHIINQCDDVVYIPSNSSLNLGMCANVVLYDRIAKGDFDRSSRLLIEARDTNNNTKVS